MFMLNVVGAQDGPIWIPFASGVIDPSPPTPPTPPPGPVVPPSPPSPPMPPVPPTPPGTPPRARIDEERSGSDVLFINFDIYGMYREDVRVAARDNEVFHRVSIPTCGKLCTVGLPELPVFTQILEVPLGVEINVEADVDTAEYYSFEGYNIYPAQPSRSRQDDPNEEFFIIDVDAYQSNENYPAEPAAIGPGDIGIVRGHRIVFLRLYPVQYNPASKVITTYRKITVKVEYNPPDRNESIDPRLLSEPFEQLLSATVMNYKKPVRFAGPESMIFWDRNNEKQAGSDYLILTPDAFYISEDPDNPIVRLADWKRRKGYMTRVVTLSEMNDQNPEGGIKAEDIRDYLQNAYDKWDPVPTYILLIGDVGDDAGNPIVPTNYGLKHEKEEQGRVGTDLHYTRLDGVDYFPDVLIGRLSVDTLQQATQVIDKILIYETSKIGFSAPDNYYKDVCLVQLFEDFYGDGQEDMGFKIIEFAEEIWEYLSVNGLNPIRIYDYSGCCFYGPQKFEDGTSLPSYLKGRRGDFPWTGDTFEIWKVVQNGCFLMVYNGHGSRTSWVQPSLDVTDIPILANDIKAPVVFSIGCDTGWFDNETDIFDEPYEDTTDNSHECLCEHLLRQPNGGAVAIIGASRSSYADNDYLMKGMIDAIWPDFDGTLTSPTWFEKAGPGCLGMINWAGKFYMKTKFVSDPFSAYSTKVRPELHFEMYNLFGDPEMPIWTREPGDLQMFLQYGIRGPRDIEVDVADSLNKPVENAIVVLTLNDITFREVTDENGYTFFTVNEAGIYGVTITANNFWPYEGTIEVY